MAEEVPALNDAGESGKCAAAAAGFKRVAPFLLIGPISGPLAAGVYFNLREGRPVLAGLYAIALVEIAITLPMITVHLGLRLL
jgi:hypothetical protein